MNPRLASMAALCREGAMPALVLAWIAAFGSAGIDHTRAAPIVARVAPLLTADAKFAGKTPEIVTQPIVAAASVIPATLSVTEAPAIAPAPGPKELDPVVTASLTDPSEVLRPET